MLSAMDTFLFEYFSNKKPDFNSLDYEEKKIILDVALSYSDLFSYIRPHLQANVFYDEYNGRGDFSYYPHYFLVNFENAKWFVENCINMRESFFLYGDWFSDDEINLLNRSKTVPNSLQDQHFELLKQESDNTLSFIEIEQIIENVVNASLAINYKPSSIEGILEFIEDRSDFSESEHEKLKILVEQLQ
jgi:hypothetical protein